MIWWDKNVCCNINYECKFQEKLKEQFFNRYNFSNHDNNKFILSFLKGPYRYKYMDIGKNWMKHHYLKKKASTVT